MKLHIISTFTITTSGVDDQGAAAGGGTAIISKNAFFGLDQSASLFTFLSRANNSSEVIYAHKYGANTAREDSTGSLWFTQSTENQNEERLYKSLNNAIPDGALYRLPLSEDGTLSKPELVLENLYFANGFSIELST